MEKANLRGRVVRFLGDKELIAVVHTEFGDALLDVNVDFDWDLKIGDVVEIEEASFYIQNGRIVTTVSGEVVKTAKGGEYTYYCLIGE